MPSHPPERPKKLQRISQACDLCHRRSIRCRPSTENPQHQCQNCFDFAVTCTYNRPSRRRRHQSIPSIAPPNLLPSQPQGISPTSPAIKIEGQYDAAAAFQLVPEYAGAYPAVREATDADQLGIAWRSFAVASLPTIERFLEVYMEVVYPIFPLFHGPTLWSRIRKRHHLTDRGFFASVMAACALAAARARDGAVGDKYRFEEGIEGASETFFLAAQDAIFKDFSKAMGLGYLRACALLALTSIQQGHLQTMHQYSGHFHTLTAMQSFHDEEKWPAGLSIEETEERRRLFWSMYCWDIYTSVVFNTILQSQETHSNVRYPSEVNDEELAPDIASPIDEFNWFRGWNFVVDLYRVLEHTLKRRRRNKQHRDDRVSVVRMLIPDVFPDSQIMENLLNLYYQLPPRFKDYKILVTGDKGQDIFGFQAANIQATLQLVRITLFESNNWHDVQQKCDVAEQVLSTFHSIQPHYLRAISTPLVHHLGGIGQVLASVMQGTLTEDSYQRVRSLLNSMADLLEGLETGLQPTTGASRGLRNQIGKIDQFMHAQRQMLASSIPSIRPSPTSLPHMPAPGAAAAAAAPGYATNLQQNSEASAPAPAPAAAAAAAAAGATVPTNSLGMTTPLDEFQLPPDVIGEWPWPFDFTQEGNMPVVNGYGGEMRRHPHQHSSSPRDGPWSRVM